MSALRAPASLNPRQPVDKMLGEWADVDHALTQLQADCEAVGKFLERRREGEMMAARGVACILSAHLLCEKLLRFQLAAMVVDHQEAKQS